MERPSSARQRERGETADEREGQAPPASGAPPLEHAPRRKEWGWKAVGALRGPWWGVTRRGDRLEGAGVLERGPWSEGLSGGPAGGGGKL